MSKSGQPATKADQGGQRVPDTSKKTSGSDAKTPSKAAPGKAQQGKKTGK